MPELLVRGIPGLHAHWYLDGNEYIVQVHGGFNKIDGWWAGAETTNGSLANIYAHEHYDYEIDALMALEGKMRGLGELEKGKGYTGGAMSQHTHTVCDGCDEEMSTIDYGHMRGAIGFYGYGEQMRHFHNPRCLALFAEKMANELDELGSEPARVTVEDLEESDDLSM